MKIPNGIFTFEYNRIGGPLRKFITIAAKGGTGKRVPYNK
jgi:hypothetical protein